MLKKFGMLTVWLTILAVAAYNSPSIKANLARYITGHVGWTEAARLADPVGFVDHVERTVEQDLEKLRKRRRELSTELDKVAQTQRDVEAKKQFAEHQADAFRAVYHADEYPVSVLAVAYSSPESIETQISWLLAEVDGYTKTMASLADLKCKAEAKLQELTVQISATEAQLAVVGTKRELLAVRNLSSSNQALLEALDQLLDDNRATATGNPVRNVEELIAAAQREGRSPAVRRRVQQFLASKTDCQPDKVGITKTDDGQTTSIFQQF